MMEETQIHTTEEKKSGYKKTKLGWIPEEWEIKTLNEIGSFYKGKGISKKELLVEGMPCIHYSEIYTKYDFWTDHFDSKINPASANESRLIQKGDILFAGSGETVEDIGKCVVYDSDEPAYAGGDIIIFRPTKPHSRYLGFLLNHELVNKQTSRLAQGNSVVHIYSSNLKNILIPYPKEIERKNISITLLKWDSILRKTDKLITHKKLLKKGLMQELLSGKERLPSYNEKWKENKLEKFFVERNEKGFENLPLLSIGEAGVYPQSDSNKKDTSNKDKSKYKRICPGDIGYNTMRLWQGRNALSQLEGIISPAYTVVTPNENAHAEFFKYLFKLPEVVHKFYRNSQGLVSDTLNCKFKDFKIVKVMLPPTVEEQIAIANVLVSVDKEIELLKKKKEMLQNQKKGLMQQLLTGKKRFLSYE